MKKVVLGIILFSVSVISYSQVIEKGKRILCGSLGFGFSHHKNESTTVSDPQKASGFSINLNPSLGKAVKNNSVFGYYLSLGYSHGKNEDPNQNDVAKSNGYTSGGGYSSKNSSRSTNPSPSLLICRWGLIITGTKARNGQIPAWTEPVPPGTFSPE